MSKNMIYSDFNGNFEKTNRRDISIHKNINAIRESIKNIILTPRGSELMDPNFGCGIHNLLFSPNDKITEDIMKDIIKRDLLNYEPRISVKSIKINSEDSKIDISVSYFIKETDASDNVYVIIQD